jgi:hypothetical protein
MSVMPYSYRVAPLTELQLKVTDELPSVGPGFEVVPGPLATGVLGMVPPPPPPPFPPLPGVWK